MLASLLAAAQEVDVRMLDDGKEWWRDFVVPGTTLLAALVGGLGGVLIGGKMNRTTLSKLEADRAERETTFENARAERELTGRRRQALGAMRVLLSECERVKSGFELDRDTPSKDLAEHGAGALRMRPEDLHALAIWLPDDAWTQIALNLDAIEQTHLARDQNRKFIAMGGTPDVDDSCVPG